MLSLGAMQTSLIQVVMRHQFHAPPRLWRRGILSIADTFWIFKPARYPGWLVFNVSCSAYTLVSIINSNPLQWNRSHPELGPPDLLFIYTSSDLRRRREGDVFVEQHQSFYLLMNWRSAEGVKAKRVFIPDVHRTGAGGEVGAMKWSRYVSAVAIAIFW
jgi:hypothetical protein